jgi:hypothetical protein
MSTPEVPEVSLAGLRIPASLAPEIIAALRDAYPTITDGRDDEGVVRGVLLWLIESTLVQYRGRQAEAGAAEAVEAVRAEHADKATKAREQARKDAKTIREVPSGDAEPNMPPGQVKKEPAKKAAARKR